MADSDYNKITLDGFPVQSAIAIARDLAASGLPVPKEIWKCNHFTNPVSSTAYGHLLMTKLDIDELDFDATDHELSITTPPLPEVKAKNLIIVPGKTRRIGKGKADNDNAIYIVEVANARWFGNNHYYTGEIRNEPDTGAGIYNQDIQAFNVPSGLYPGQYYDLSRRDTDGAGTYADWTWEEIMGRLWPSWMGTKPTTFLPYTPDGTPIGFDFRNASAIEAMEYYLMRLNCGLRYTGATGKFDVVRIGDADAAFTYAVSNLGCRQLGDSEFNGSHMMMPGGVIVCFHAEATQPGSENTYPLDSTQWRMNSIIRKERTRTTGTVPDAIADVFHVIWDDLIAEYDPFTDTVSNDSDLDDRADERRDRFFAALGDTDQCFHKVYSGVHEISPGSLCRGVSWREDFEEGGWVTEIVNHPSLLYTVDPDTGHLAEEPAVTTRNKNYEPIQEYLYPHEVAFVRITDVISSGVYPAVEVRQDGSDLSTVDGIEVGAVNAN